MTSYEYKTLIVEIEDALEHETLFLEALHQAYEEMLRSTNRSTAFERFLRVTADMKEFVWWDDLAKTAFKYCLEQGVETNEMNGMYNQLKANEYSFRALFKQFIELQKRFRVKEEK